MQRQSLLTPCPIPSRQNIHIPSRRESVLSTADDSTADIEFTAAFGPSLRSVKPVRRGGGGGVGTGTSRQSVVRREKNVLEFTIHEDRRAEDGQVENRRASALPLPQPARRDLISKPPQRPRQRVSFMPTMDAQPRIDLGRSAGGGVGSGLSQLPRRPVVQRLEEHTEKLAPLPEDTSLNMTSTTIPKPARRGTIYIPNDDTTMPSMYMGIFSPIKDLDTRNLAQEVKGGEDFTGIAAQMVRKRGPRRSMMPGSPKRVPLLEPTVEFEQSGVDKPLARSHGPRRSMLAKDYAIDAPVEGGVTIGSRRRAPRASMIAVSPKRGPLDTLRRPLQAAATNVDKYGHGSGKENIPPGALSLTEHKSQEGYAIMKRSVPEKEFLNEHQSLKQDDGVRRSRFFEPTASSGNKTMEDHVKDRKGTKPVWNSGVRRPTEQHIIAKKSITKSSPEQGHEMSVDKRASVPTRFVILAIKPDVVDQSYPLLVEDLASPSMYEDNWLGHQEIAMTQLVNNLFGVASPEARIRDEGLLRIRLLDSYGNSDNAMLYKRLQGALLYGALSIPSEVTKSSARLNSDLGRRKTFTDLWLNTYDWTCLRAALEVVTGRRLPKGSPGSSSSRRSSGDTSKGSKQGLRQFIETMIIRNEDGKPDSTASDYASWSFQRTILRSLMLIKVLDSVKEPQARLFNGCLFQVTSSYKTSKSVVQALFQLLNPSAGDPLRALSHVGFTVSHSQFPLEEYTYQIDNLAIDLRDGVRLTRLVELLLYPSASESLEHAHDPDSTTTVTLPTGELLSLTEGQRDWPLSQHLKLPCIGRATKLYNVQICLSALEGVRGMSHLLQDIKAEDVVDGYREKTVRLLWGLTSKWGLGGLVDWIDLQREIKRLCHAENTHVDDEMFDMLDDVDQGYGRYKVLLKSWAQAVAHTRGLVVRNLTTSFADGQVFKAIVDEYEPYLVGTTLEKTPMKLSDRLKLLGCSEQFAGLFSKTETSSHQMHIFDRDFVLAALAFLCSRLLGPSKSTRAAVTIQRAWRRHWSEVMVARKSHLKMVAESCAGLVQSKAQTFEANGDEMQMGNISTKNDEAETGFHQIPSPCVAQSPEREDIWLTL